MDDVITLVAKRYSIDENGNQIETTCERTVFCKVKTTNRDEFYDAAQAGMHPNYVFTLSHYKDYMNEPEIIYVDWTGAERHYTVTRTYIYGDKIDLTAEEKVVNL